MNKTPITVVIAEDHTIVREGLKALLELRGEFKVIGEASSGRDAIDMVQRLQPDVILMDIAMPILNGFEATRQILSILPNAKILILSAHSDDEYLEHLMSMGVSGYLVKQNSGQGLVHAIRQVSKGKISFSSSITARITNLKQQNALAGQKEGKRQTLTFREAEVLQLVAEGYANKQIAALMGISIKTVEKHRQQVMDKLNLHETAGLTRHAIATGVIESSIQDTTG